MNDNHRKWGPKRGPKIKKPRRTLVLQGFLWWELVDSNHRSIKQQIYSLSPLATRESSLI